jgi:hypothetical protein
LKAHKIELSVKIQHEEFDYYPANQIIRNKAKQTMILNHMGYIEAFFKYSNFENIKQIATLIKLDSKLSKE